MKKFEEFVDGLNDDMIIPDSVDKRFEDTLNMVGVSRRHHSNMWLKVASVALAVVVAGSIFCVSNPTLAAKLPVIGNIFSLVEKNVSYSGNYSNNHTLVADGKKDEKLTAEDQGVKLTASEVYSDGLSVFVTIKMDSQKYDFSKLLKYVATGGQSVTMMTSYGNNTESTKGDYDIPLEGKSEGKSSFIGMMKFEKGEYSVKDGYLNVKVNEIFIEGQGKLGNEDGLVKVKGKWNLKIPYTVDTNKSKEIVVNKTAPKGTQIKKIFVSPYQAAVFTKPASRKPYANVSKDDFEKNYKKNYVKKDTGECKITYDEFINLEEKNYFEYGVFDQDGNKLQFQEVGDRVIENLDTDMFSVNGKKVTKLHIFITEKEENMFSLIKAKTEKKAKEVSEFDFVVDLK